MKLYTEEQVREAFHDGIVYATMHSTIIKELDECVQDTVDSLTPIELPSDEEIRETSKNVDRPGLFWENEFARDSFVQCGKWMKEQILNQNK